MHKKGYVKIFSRYFSGRRRGEIIVKLEPMRYKGYTWRYNPKQINISSQRNVKEILIPHTDSVVDELGGMKRVVKGTGEFFGDSCIDDFEQLRSILLEGGSGYLSIPKMEPFLAIFKKLEMTERAEPDVIEYTFEFLETGDKGSLPYGFSTIYHDVKDGESLWDIANEYGTDVLKLLEMNTNIKRPDSIVEGDKVRVL